MACCRSAALMMPITASLEGVAVGDGEGVGVPAGDGEAGRGEGDCAGSIVTAADSRSETKQERASREVKALRR